MATVVDEINRKAIDTLSNVLSSFETGRITGEAFRIAVQTVWGICGGVITTPEFEDLIKAFSAEARAIPPEPRIKILEREDMAVVIVRTGERVTNEMMSRVPASQNVRVFDMEDEAMAYVCKAEESCRRKGMVAI